MMARVLTDRQPPSLGQLKQVSDNARGNSREGVASELCIRSSRLSSFPRSYSHHKSEVYEETSTMVSRHDASFDLKKRVVNEG